MWTIVIISVVATALAVWLISWLRIVPADQVALKDYFGWIPKTRFKSGLRILSRFWGINLILIPKRQMKFSIRGNEEHDMRSSDKQPMFVDLSGEIRFPYDDPEYLKRIVEAGVPLEAKALDKWIESEVLGGVRDIVALYDHVRLLSRGSIPTINDDVKEFFLGATGLFARSGICGSDPKDFTPGKGEVIIRIEKIRPTKELDAALQAPVTAKYRADAASQTARQQAKEIGIQVLVTVALSTGVDVDDLPALKAFMDKISADPSLRTKPASQGGYKEAFASAVDQLKRDRSGAEELRIGNPDGSAMKGELPAFAAAALLLNRGGGSRKPGRGPQQDKTGKGSADPSKTEEEKQAEYERIMKGGK